ncbi:transposase, partial [Corynebacterium variabile]|uniref:transposase n=1 Tax=Corynebacterium variabile TaxID=1727 RepID=UPI003F51209B
MDTRCSGTRPAREDVTVTEKTPGRRPRRTFSPEYKHEAARLVIDTGRTIAEVARELGVGSQSLGKWVAAERATEAGEPTGELTLDERAELKVSSPGFCRG